MEQEKTLVLIKPEGIKRGIIGKVITRFEDAGFKIIGMKMVWADKDFAKKHYTEDIEKRHNKKIRDMLLDYIVEGPVIAMVLQGIDVIENIRKIVGGTEPKSSPPGTIRGDFAHVSYAYADAKGMAVKNIIHASADKKDAEHEISLWFSKKDLHDYKTLHDFLM